jgi:hypothetical protein
MQAQLGHEAIGDLYRSGTGPRFRNGYMLCYTSRAVHAGEESEGSGARGRSLVMRLVLMILLLLVPILSQAADGGAIAAALKDEAAECRYFLDLCDRITAALNRGDLGQVDRLATERYDAGHVIRAKHDKMPECFRQCRGIDLTKFGGDEVPQPTAQRTPSAKK